MKHRNLLLTFLTTFAIVNLLSAQPLLLEENFDYAPGTTLVGTNGWVEQGGPSTTNVFTITQGNLSYPSYASSNIGNYLEVKATGQDAYRAFASQSSGSVYIAFLVEVTQANETGDYFFALQPAPGNTAFTSRLFIKRNTSNALAFGISKGTETAVYSGFDYALNTTYLVVVKFEMVSGNTNDVISVFINPTVGAAEPATPLISTTGGTTNDPAALAAILLRQGNSANAPTLFIDGIRVATTWEEAVKQVSGDVNPPVATFNPANGATNVALDVMPTISFNEPIFKTDNTPVQNDDLPSLITFVDGNSNPVAFSATINSERTLITVTPAGQLQQATSYTISVAPVRDEAENQSAVQSATFTTLSLAPALSITSPVNNATMPVGDVTITFTVSNFTVGAVGSGADGHIKVTVDGGAPFSHFSTNPIVLTELSIGNHSVVLELVSDNGQSLSPVVTATVSFTLTQPASGELFFSEYIEGSSNNKALEIFNPNSFAVDLSAYSVKLFANGSATATNTLNLTGTLAANGVYVIANASASQAILSLANVTSTVTFFNGDDALGLYKNDVLIDVIGTIGSDPGTAWDVAGVTNATVDKTLVRKSHISQGNTDWAQQAGTNADNSEWIVYPLDTFSYLGSHQFGLNNQSDILSFSLPQQTQAATINNTAKTVNITVINGTNVSNLVPTFTLSSGANAYVNGVLQTSGVSVVDFTNPVVYQVVAQNNVDQTNWTVTVTVDTNLSGEAEILSFTVPNQLGNSVINSAAATVSVTVPYGTDVTNLVPTITISNGATISPASGVAQNFTNPVQYTVTAQNGTQKVWTVTVTVQQLTTIYEIQYTTNSTGDSPYNNQTVTTSGIVTAIQGTQAFYIQDGVGAWNGIYVYKGTQTIETPAIGSHIVIKAKVYEYYGFTELKDIVFITVLSTGNPLPAPADVTAAQMGEPYEGVLVRAEGYTCVHNGSGNNWTSKYVKASEPNDTLYVFRQMYTDFLPIVGKTYNITGLGNYHFSQYKIAPRNAADVVESQINLAPVISNVEVFPEIPVLNQPIFIRATITDDGGQQNLTNTLRFGYNSENLENVVNFVPVGSTGTTFVATIPPQTESGILYYRIIANDGQLETTYNGQINLTSIDKLLSTKVTVYPNPAENQLFVSGVTGSYSVVNILGQQVVSGILEDASSAIDVSRLNSGVYFIHVLTNNKSYIMSFLKK